MEAIYRHPKIYLIAGKAKHGKTTTGSIIKEEYERRGKKVAATLYARYLKDYAKSFFGWNGKEETKPRELLQQLGTNIIRQKLNKEEFFVNRTIEDIEILSYFFDVIIIDDVRLEIEINKPKSVFDNIVCIDVKRHNFDNGLTKTQQRHITETALDNYDKFDYSLYNDGSIDDLKQKIITIIDKEDEKDAKNDK
jgi:dephospho-CoA kinase